MTDAVRTTTLEELISRVAFRLGDQVLLESSDAGSTTTFIDTLNIPMGNEDLARRQLVFLSGAYRGNVKIIQLTDAASHTITFDPATAGNVPAGVSAMVINKRAMGYTYLEYKRAINMAIDDAYPIYREAVALDVPVLDENSPAIDLSASAINEVYDVQWQDDDGSWWPLAQAAHVGYPGWQVERYSNQIIINDYDLRRDLYGVTIRVLGEGKPAPLSTYSDTTRIHPEWLTARACYHLCLMGLDRDITGLRSKQVLTFQAEAEQRMTLIRTRREPASRMTRSS